VPADSRRREIVVHEYLGDPPRKPGKQGSFHKSAYSYFVRDDALTLFKAAARGAMITSPTTIRGREGEHFSQIWITNFVDCLDTGRTVAAPQLKEGVPGMLGVIKNAVFDETRWDGSELFVVPQDGGFFPYCTEDFVGKWKASKLKGIVFSRFLFDPDAIAC
jgi:hypothetical protein